MDSLKYCDKYGVLYTWESALNACPSGWHLPSLEEFRFLESIPGGGNKGVYEGLSEGGTTGFNAQLGGALLNYNYGNAIFARIGTAGYYWTSTNGFRPTIYSRYVYFVFHSRIKKVFKYQDHNWSAFSVRCVKNGAVK
jgi:uncharacterized protein (TIGR02145 family)